MIPSLRRTPSLALCTLASPPVAISFRRDEILAGVVKAHCARDGQREEHDCVADWEDAEPQQIPDDRCRYRDREAHDRRTPRHGRDRPLRTASAFITTGNATTRIVHGAPQKRDGEMNGTMAVSGRTSLPRPSRRIRNATGLSHDCTERRCPSASEDRPIGSASAARQSQGSMRGSTRPVCRRPRISTGMNTAPASTIPAAAASPVDMRSSWCRARSFDPGSSRLVGAKRIDPRLTPMAEPGVQSAWSMRIDPSRDDRRARNSAHSARCRQEPGVEYRAGPQSTCHLSAAPLSSGLGDRPRRLALAATRAAMTLVS